MMKRPALAIPSDDPRGAVFLWSSRTSPSLRLAALLGSALTLAAGWQAPALAQVSPSRIVPETAAPPTKPDDASISLPQTQTSRAPAGSENLTVTLASVSVEGGRADLAPQVDEIVRPLQGRQVSVAELYDAASRIEGLYARAGQVLARATVPPQQLRDGSTFRIVIVEGFIQSIDDSALPASVRGPVRRRLAPLVGARGVTMRQIERRLLLAARVPGVSLRSTLVPGTEIGGAKLVLNADYAPLSGSVSAGNSLPDSFDTWSFDARMAANSVFGAGEQIYAFASTGTDFDLTTDSPLRRIAGIGAFIPLGSDGLTLNAEYIHADTNALVAAGELAVRGKLDRAALRLRYPLVLARRETLSIQGAFELVDERQTFPDFGVDLSLDRLRLLSLGLEWGKALSQGTTLGADLAFTQGFDDFGARNRADAVQSGVGLSRMGSRPDFTRLNARLSVSQQLGGNVRADAYLRGQASLTGALPASQQFSLDAADGLSGFTVGTISTDSGGTARLELATPQSLAPNFSATPYLFAAAGAGWVAQPTVLELGDVRGWSLGAGLRMQAARRIGVLAELAHSYTNILSSNQTRLTVGVSIGF